MIIPFKQFTGEFPRTDAALLPEHAAQFAMNCDFLAGVLRGVRDNDPVAGISSASTIKALFTYEGGASAGQTFWWDRDVDAVRSPVVNDQYARFYWADGTGFYVSRGDLGGGGEPSSNNRYKVGVPRPASALSLVGNILDLPGIVSYALTVSDERADGTLENTVSIGASQETGATSMAFTFYARAAQEVTAASTSTTTTENTQPQTNFPVTSYGTGTVGDGGASVMLYESGDGTLYGYYSDPIVTPPSSMALRYQSRITGESVDTTIFRLGATLWYAQYGNAPIPSNATGETSVSQTTEIKPPFIGPVVIMTMTRSDGSKLTASVRTDSNKTSWPPELPGLSATLTVSGTYYSVKVASSAASIEQRAYTYTYVNQYGEEGAPADPLEVECGGANAIITAWYAVPPSGYCPISKVRIYRTATGTTTDYLLVDEVTVNQSYPLITDSVKTEALGEALSTHNYYPPDQGLKGICLMANGIMVGFKGNELWFSEPYMPYAWNPTAIKPLPNRIVGICPFEGGLYVTTTANAYIIMGATPDAMTDARLPAIQAGVSKRSIVDMGSAIAYASRDGIVMAQGSQASLDKSFQFFSRKEWRDLTANNLANIRLAAHDGALLIYMDNGAALADGSRGYLLRFEEDARSLTRIDTPYFASFVNPVADILYMSVGATVVAFGEGTTRKANTWQSKNFRMAKPGNFGAVQFNGAGSLTFSVYVDGTLRYTVPVTLTADGRTVQRLPSGFLGSVWSFRVACAANTKLEQMIVAQTVAELQGV